MKAEHTGAAASFLGKRGKPIEGRVFTPLSKPLTSKVPESASLRYYRENKRKLSDPRHMLCTDIQIQSKDVNKAFMRAWNLLVGHGMRYVAAFKEMAKVNKDPLTR